MRISKLYLVVCAAALCGSIVTVRADDTPAQAAARAALEEKMNELNAQSASTNAVQTPAPAMAEQPAQPAAATTPATPAPAEKPQPAPAAPEQPAPMAVTPSGAAVQEPTNPPAATTTLPSTPPPAKKPAMTVAPAVAPAPSSDHGLFAPVPPPSGGASIPVPSEENEQPTMTSQTPPPVAVQQPVYTEPSQNTKAAYPGKELGLKPITAPPLPISPMQQAQLQALLDKYNANAITPEQYQAERAKILAEPK